jgi:hypothetical protein
MSGFELVLAFLAGVVMGGALDRSLRADDREQGRLVVATDLGSAPVSAVSHRPDGHRTVRDH